MLQNEKNLINSRCLRIFFAIFAITNLTITKTYYHECTREIKGVFHLQEPRVRPQLWRCMFANEEETDIR